MARLGLGFGILFKRIPESLLDAAGVQGLVIAAGV